MTQTTLMQSRNSVETVLVESTNKRKNLHKTSNMFQEKFSDISNFLSSKDWVPFGDENSDKPNFFSCNTTRTSNDMFSPRQQDDNDDFVTAKWICMDDPFSSSSRHVLKPRTNLHDSSSSKNVSSSRNKVFGRLHQHILSKQVANTWVEMGCTPSKGKDAAMPQTNFSSIVTPIHCNTANPGSKPRSRRNSSNPINHLKSQRPRHSYSGSRRISRDEDRNGTGESRTTPTARFSSYLCTGANNATPTQAISAHTSQRRAVNGNHRSTQRSRPRPERPLQSTIRPKSRGMSSAEGPKKAAWRSAKDPKSGRVYYYNVETRETQWRKPMELASAEERAQMLAKEKKQKDFFAAMEANILKNMQVAGATPVVEEKKKTAVKIQVLPKPRMVRTISSMDENVLRDLTKVPSRRSLTTEDSGDGISSQRSSTTSQRSLKLGELNTLMESASEFERSSAELLGQSMNLDFSLSPTPPEPKKSSSLQSEELFGESLVIKEGEELTFEELQALTALEHAAEEMKRSSPVAIPAHSMPVGMNFEDSTSTVKTENLSEDRANKSLPPNAEPPLKQLARPRMTKRNTCGTIYVGTTMSAPDKDATIKCVCGVYRAHILQSAKEEAASFMGPSEGSDKYIIFNDFEDQRDPILVDRSPVAIQALSLEHVEKSVPTLDEITGFYRDVFRRSQMETDCIIMSLIYVERLIKETNGELRPRVSNWRSILFSSMVLSSKVWDDLSMWNADFSQTCPAGVTVFTLSRINELEVAVLNAFKYNVKVKSSEYAKYYFLLRSMIIKSGLAGDDLSSMTPLDVEGARKLEQVSSSFSHQFNTKPPRLRATKSLGGDERTRMLQAQLSGDLSSSNSPGEKSKVSLEHVVNM